jgi:hypothetical protein
MTCREFIEAAEFLTPSELGLMETGNVQVAAHARQCSGCGEWLQSQLLLGSALRVLRTSTEQREAGPEVERAVLQAFRAQDFEPLAGVAADRAAPAAWKLSRFFEVGAYAAVAAALIVGIFLGAQMWRDRHAPPSQAQIQVAAPDVTAPAADLKPSGNVPAKTEVTPVTIAAVDSTTYTKRSQPVDAHRTAASAVDRQGFVALMFCDPLICSGEEQVIRMELPASAAGASEGNGNQPVIADVVIGEDGLVRAMRIVN